MSQVNFVQQINLFMEFSRRNRLTSHDRVLWLGLFYCANRIARMAEAHEWPDDYFQVSNSELMDYAGLEERAIRNSRNRLRQFGLIDFQKGDGKRHDPYYRLNYLTIIGYKIAPGGAGDAETTGDNSAPGDAGGSVGGNVGGHAGGGARDAPETGDKSAPGGAGGAYRSTPIHSNIINTNLGTANSGTKPAAKDGRTARAREDGFGLIDLGDDGFDAGGLVSLAWDDRAVMPR